MGQAGEKCIIDRSHTSFAHATPVSNEHSSHQLVNHQWAKSSTISFEIGNWICAFHRGIKQNTWAKYSLFGYIPFYINSASPTKLVTIINLFFDKQYHNNKLDPQKVVKHLQLPIMKALDKINFTKFPWQPLTNDNDTWFCHLSFWIL